jgi:hypothetical protein
MAGRKRFSFLPDSSWPELPGRKPPNGTSREGDEEAAATTLRIPSGTP